MVVPFNGILNLLSYLRRKNFNLGIVTSLPSIYAIKEIKAANLGPFRCLVCYHDTSLHKPYPQPIIKALEKLDSNPNHTIYIGDQLADILAGKAANVKTGIVLWGVLSKNWDLLLKAKPMFVFYEVNDILNSLF